MAYSSAVEPLTVNQVVAGSIPAMPEVYDSSGVDSDTHIRVLRV